MSENIDLTKILEGLEGIELHCTIFGKVKLKKIDKGSGYPLVFECLEGIKGNSMLSKYGTLSIDYPNAECIVFPSKEQRDWSKFVRPIKKGTPIVYSPLDTKDIWEIGYYYSYFAPTNTHLITFKKEGAGVSRHKYIIPFDKFNPNDIEESLKYNIQK